MRIARRRGSIPKLAADRSSRWYGAWSRRAAAASRPCSSSKTSTGSTRRAKAFVANLAAGVAGTRTLFVVNYRPEYEAAWLGAPHCRVVPLPPLRQEATAELLADLLGADASVRELAARIASRTRGNPFFVEEVVQSLAESGSLAGARGAYRLVREPNELAIPATVQAVLAARIDRLAEQEKDVLQQAAVIGKEFSLPVLAHVTGKSALEVEGLLYRLISAQFVYEQALFPETVYAFKHPLTQEVAYHSQLSERRSKTHGRSLARSPRPLQRKPTSSLRSSRIIGRTPAICSKPRAGRGRLPNGRSSGTSARRFATGRRSVSSARACRRRRRR